MSNITYNITEDPFEFCAGEITGQVILLASSLCGIILNIFNILAVCYSAHELSCQYLLVIGQSIADILFSFAYIPLSTYQFGWCRYVAGNLHKCVLGYLVNFVNSVSVLVFLNLLVIALDHFIAIYRPLRYQTYVTRKRLFCVFACMYAITLVIFVVPALILVPMLPLSTEVLCTEIRDGMFVIYTGAALFVLDLVVITSIYVYIFMRARSSSQGPHGAQSDNYKKTMTSLWIIATFLFFLAIDGSLWAIESILDTDALIGIRTFTWLLPSFNCICDPIIYGIRLSKVKHGYRKLWHAFRVTCLRQSEIDLQYRVSYLNKGESL